MVTAAFSSRSRTSPQDGQTWVRTDRLFAPRCLQRLPAGTTPLQSWLVYWLVSAGRHCAHLTPGACCRGVQDGAQRCPAGSAAALGQVAVSDQRADLQVFELDHVVL